MAGGITEKKQLWMLLFFVPSISVFFLSFTTTSWNQFSKPRQKFREQRLSFETGKGNEEKNTKFNFLFIRFSGGKKNKNLLGKRRRAYTAQNGRLGFYTKALESEKKNNKFQLYRFRGVSLRRFFFCPGRRDASGRWEGNKQLKLDTHTASLRERERILFFYIFLLI